MFNGYETKELVDAHVKALLRELDQREAAGDAAACKAIREQLKVFGHEAKAPHKRAASRPTRKSRATRAAAKPAGKAAKGKGDK